MAKPIQKKIAMALSQKKHRATQDFEPLYNTWQTRLKSSEIADLIPSLNELQIDIEKQATTSSQLQELFQIMINYLKINYFDNQTNEKELNNYLKSLSQEIQQRNDKERQEAIESFFQVNKRKISLFYLNSQPDLSIYFSKLVVNILSRRIKDSLGILPNQQDNDNICNFLKAISEFCPDLQEDTLLWFEEQLNSYTEKMKDTVDDISVADIDNSLAAIMLMPPEEVMAITRTELLKKNQEFRKDILLYHANVEPVVTLLIAEKINKSAIHKTYRKLYNKLTKELHLQPLELKNLHSFIIKVIDYRIRDISKSTHYTFEKIQKVCNRQLKVQKQIIKLSQKVENQRSLVHTFVEQINTLPVSNEIAILNEFFRKQLQSPLYLKMNNTLNRVIKYKRFKSYKTFVIDLLQYIKTIITYPILESSLILQITMEHDSLIPPLSNDDLLQITKIVKKLEKNSSIQNIKRECSYLLHATVYQKELITNLLQLKYLIEADFKETITHFIDPFSDPELLHLIKSVNETTASSPQIDEMIEYDGISEIKVNLLAYQQYLRVLGKARLQAIQDPSNENINQRISGSYQAIELLYEKLKVIIDLINIVENIPEASLTPGIKEQLTNIKAYSSDIKEYFTYISHVAHEFGYLKVDPKDIFLVRITRGDFFRVKDHDILKTATIALLFRISPFAIIDGIIAQFNHYDNEQRQESLYFIQNYLKSDTQSLLFSAVNPEKSDFFGKLTILINLAKQNNLQTEELESLMNEKIIEKQQHFLDVTTMLEGQSLSKDFLIRRINTISHKLKENDFCITKLDEYLVEISKILDNKNFSNFNQNDKFQLLETFNSLNEQCDTLPYYQQSFNKLRQKLQNLLTSKSTATEKKPDNIINKEIAYSLFELINNTIEEVDNEPLHDKMIQKFIKNIESEFTKAFTAIDISELRELSWYGDEQRIQQGLNPNAPAIRNYQQLQELTTYFVRFAIFYQVSKDNTPIPYAKLEQIKPVYKFFQSALLKSFELKAITTASILFRAIQTPIIKRLKLSSPEAETVYRQYLSKTKEAQINLAKMFRVNNVLPLLSFIQQKLMFIYKKNYGSQFEHLSNIGRALIEFDQKKEAIQSKLLSDVNYFEQMKNFLAQLGITTTEGMLINVEKANHLLTVRSHDVKRDPTKKVSLNELKTISNLKKYLLQCHSHSVFYQISDTNHEKAIIDWMSSIIKSDNRFMHFADSIDTIFLIKSINEIQGNNYKRFFPDLASILSEYHKKIAETLKFNSIEKAKPLEHFFGQYLKNMKLNEFKDAEESGLFSQNNKIKELLSKIDEQYKAYQNLQAQLDKEKSQQAYSQLLEDVLAGVNKRTLQLPTDGVNQDSRSAQSLLPENEYDIPSAEPEHPDRIGINRTMSFTTSEQKSVLSLFNTDELKNEFIAAFPWALHYDNLDKLNEVSFDITPNLLGTPTLYSTQLQLASMEFVLLAMDALGKIAGFSGDLTIQNFDRINDIIGQLQWLTTQLQSDNVNEAQLLLQIEENLQEMNFRNNEFFDMQQLYNPPFSVESNPNMNGFCHINEHLVHQLTGIPYDASMLAPNTPDSPYVEKINEVFLEDRQS